MSFELPTLPYALDALAPHLSKETLEFHHGRHHKAYVDKLNQLIPGSGFEKATLEDLIRKATGDIFNQAAQAWNHTFHWQSLSPKGGGGPKGRLADAITRSFGSFDAFQKQFSEKAAGLFGSGWAWLVRKPDGGLAVLQTSNAENPLRSGDRALLTCDVWEHAYYIDYRNARAIHRGVVEAGELGVRRCEWGLLAGRRVTILSAKRGDSAGREFFHVDCHIPSIEGPGRLL